MARLAFWMISAVCLVLLVLGWFLLPERVPVHFGVDGEPDRWVSRARAVLEMGTVMGGMMLLFAGLAAWMSRISFALLNLPSDHKEWWAAEPERRARLRELLAEDAWALGALTLALLGGVTLLTWLTAYQQSPRLGWGAIVLIVVYAVALLVQVLRIATVRYQPRE